MAVKRQNVAPEALGGVAGASGRSVAPDALLGGELGLNGQTAIDRKAA
jgi:hypothetical protein